MQSLTSSLSRAGYDVPERGTDEGKLTSALLGFQRANDLPPTGVVDDATGKALRDEGILPGSADVTEARPPPEPPRFLDEIRFDPQPAPARELPTEGPVPDVPVRSASSLDIEGTSARASLMSTPHEGVLSELGDRLAGEGFTSRRRGSAKLKESLGKFQEHVGLKRTGSIDRETARALVEKQLLAEEHVPPERKSAEELALRERRRLSAVSGEGDGEDEDDEGDGGDAVRATARRSMSLDFDRADNWGPRPGSERSRLARRQNQSPSDREDKELLVALAQRDRPWMRQVLEEAGNPVPRINLEDGKENLGSVDIDPNLYAAARPPMPPIDDPPPPVTTPGTVVVPSLWAQIEEGMARVERDDAGRGAATYAWDFTLRKPGRYVDEDPTELLHLVVRRAGVFDKVWEDARFALNTQLLEHEPQAERVGGDALLAALRRARVRSG